MTNSTTIFLQKWLNISDYDLAVNSEFEYEALRHGVDLTKKYYAVVIGNLKKDTSFQYNLSFNLDHSHQVVILNEFFNVETLIQKLPNVCLVGIGTPHFDLSRTIKESLEAFCYTTPTVEINIVRFENIKQFNPLINSNLSYPKLRQFFDRFETLYGDTVLLDTFWLSVLNNHNFTKTATALHIHRKTVEYRLKKIHELTGYDPHNIIDCIALISAYVCWRTKNLSILLNTLQSISDSMLPRDHFYQ